LDRVCVPVNGDKGIGSKNYALNALKDYKRVLIELDRMENCEEF